MSTDQRRTALRNFGAMYCDGRRQTRRFTWWRAIGHRARAIGGVSRGAIRDGAVGDFVALALGGVAVEPRPRATNNLSVAPNSRTRSAVTRNPSDACKTPTRIVIVSDLVDCAVLASAATAPSSSYSHNYSSWSKHIWPAGTVGGAARAGCGVGRGAVCVGTGWEREGSSRLCAAHAHRRQGDNTHSNSRHCAVYSSDFRVFWPVCTLFGRAHTWPPLAHTNTILITVALPY